MVYADMTSEAGRICTIAALGIEGHFSVTAVLLTVLCNVYLMLLAGYGVCVLLEGQKEAPKLDSLS